jgi:hypothetical protein
MKPVYRLFLKFVQSDASLCYPAESKIVASERYVYNRLIGDGTGRLDR